MHSVWAAKRGTDVANGPAGSRAVVRVRARAGAECACVSITYVATSKRGGMHNEQAWKATTRVATRCQVGFN